MTRHIQNPVIEHYSPIFRHILNLVQHMHLKKPDILGIPWNIQKPSIIASQRILRTLSYLGKFRNIQNSDIFKTRKIFTEPSQRFKMEFFSKMVKNYNYFSKMLCLKSLTRFWICLSINRYSLTCRGISSYLFFDKYLEHCLLSKIQTYSGTFTSYSGIFSHFVAYLEPCVTLAYSESWHI